MLLVPHAVSEPAAIPLDFCRGISGAQPTQHERHSMHNTPTTRKAIAPNVVEPCEEMGHLRHTGKTRLQETAAYPLRRSHTRLAAVPRITHFLDIEVKNDVIRGNKSVIESRSGPKSKPTMFEYNYYQAFLHNESSRQLVSSISRARDLHYSLHFRLLFPK